jgi:DNA-binding NtrC family response regulator
MSQTKSTVIIIEDDLDVREIVQQALQDDYILLSFDDVDTAWNMLQKGLRADLILMDIHFGRGSSGIGFANRLKKDHRLAKMRVVLLSGDTNLPELSEALAAAGFVAKPCDVKDIQAAVATALETA